MKKLLLTILSLLTLSLNVLAQEQAPAFPGAEGHGRYTTGGRGGTIVHVTNLNDSGTGSFRSAVTGGNNRIIVFDVAGVIPLNSDLTMKDNITILGQTAPYPGITIRYYTVRPGANNIIRFIRFRRGSEKSVDDGADAMWQRQKTNYMIDHCSFSWSIDEVASFYDNNNFTMQWCTLGESLNNAGHGKGAHGYGGIWGGKLASFHHNMICHVNNRSPRFCGARYDWTGYTSNKLYSQYKWQNAVQAENVDLRNCVVFNANGCYGGPGGGYINMVGNYFKSGPAATIDRITTVSYGDSGNSADNDKYWGMTSRYYLNDNIIDGNSVGWEKMKYDSSVPSLNGEYYTYDEKHYYGADSYTSVNGKDGLPVKLNAPAPAGEVTTHSASKAYEKIISYCGASLYRDEVDERYMTELQTGKATYSGTVTNKAGRIDLVSDCKGYTEENFPTGSREAGFDTDNDGIPDAWETANGLNPSDASDAKTYTLDAKGFYTNLEVYANSLVQDIMINENKSAESSVAEYYPSYKKEDGTLVEGINDGSGAQGAIVWSLSEGTASPQPAIADDVNAALSSTSVELGSNLTLASPATFTSGDITFTAFSINSSSKDNEANEGNAVKFSITPKDGYTFTPSSVSFKTSYKRTSGNSYVAASWKNGSTTTTITGTKTVNRQNQTPTEVTYTFKDPEPLTGTCALWIHLFNFIASYPTGLADVSISGTLKQNTTAIEAIKERSNDEIVSTEYYDLKGHRLTEPQRGINIRVERLANGQRVSSKVIR